MSRKKRYIYAATITMSILFIILSQHWRVQERYYRYLHDWRNPTHSIETFEEINDIFQALDKVGFQELDAEYLNYTNSSDSQFKKMLGQKEYLRLGRKDFFKKVVGDFRIADFLARDRYYRRCIRDGSADYHWLIDLDLLHALLELQVELEKRGYNQNGFSVTNGHRHPRYNKRVGGASKSRHILGQALDISIADIDKNGKYEEKDKQIVLDILDKTVIRDKGGIGRYPGTRAIHFDVRGYRARWDDY